MKVWLKKRYMYWLPLIVAVLLIEASAIAPAVAQDGVRLSALPSQDMARSMKPLPPGRGFNAANARAAVVAPPVRRVARTVAVTRTTLMPAPSAGASAAEGLQYRASGLRLIGAASLDQLRGVLSAEEQSAATGLLTTANPVEGRQLSRFIGQTTQYVSVNGDAAIVGWWHALDDAWIITRWRQADGAWRIITMGALVGADLAPTPAPATGDMPLDWPRNTKGFSSALDAHNQSSIRNFMAAVRANRIGGLVSDDNRQRRAWKAIRERRALQEAILAQVSQSPGFGDMRKIVSDAVGKMSRKDIAADREARLRLNALPANARATLRPAMAVQHPDGKTLVVQSPLAPAFLALVHAQNPPDAAKAEQSRTTLRPSEFQVFSLWVRDSQ